MSRSKQLTHGKHLDLDTHIDNGSVRLVATPAGGALDWETGEPLPHDPKTMSVITPENHPHWEEWHGVPHPGTEGEFRDNWATWQHQPEHQYKVDQIKRSCPECRKAM